MNEKTAEEKLRQTLEGNVSEDTAKRTSKRVVVRRIKKTELQTKAAASFMEDFEKKIEQSLNFGSVSNKKEKETKTSAQKPRIIKRQKSIVSDDTPVKPVKIIKSHEPALEFTAKPKPVEIKVKKTPSKPQEIKIDEPKPEKTTELKTELQVPEIETYAQSESVLEEIKPEIIDNSVEDVPELETENLETVQPEEIKIEEPAQEITSEIIDTPEEIQNFETVEVEENNVPQAEPEPEILETQTESIESVIEAEIEEEEPEESKQILENEADSSELPDIPLIVENENEVDDETQNGLPDIPIFNADNDIEENNEKIENADSELENLEEFEEFASETDNNSQQSEDFSPSADVVLNVPDEIPEQLPEIESEGGSVPVSVEMPEKTETAEDKLMADLAEAMTGTPVTLETHEPVEPYKLPEDFLNEANKDPSQQTAENKLIANIAQAMSESPLDAASDNSVQNFENELGNLNEDLASTFPVREEPLTEEIDLSAYEADESETQEPAPTIEEEPEKPETEIEPTFDEVPLPEPVDEPEPEPAEEPDLPVAPIEAEEEIPQEIETADEPEVQEEIKIKEIETEPELEPEISAVSAVHDIKSPETEIEEPELKNEIEEIKVDNNNDVNNVNDEDSDLDSSFFDGLPDDLLGAMSMPDESLETGQDDLASQEISSYSLNKNKNQAEISQEDNQPEQSLLAEDENEISPENAFGDIEESHDDFDINSLGEEFGTALSRPAYESLDNDLEPEAEEENDYGFDENSPSHGGFMNTNPGEEEEKSKVKDLRGRLAERSSSIAETDDDNEEDSKSSGRIVTPLLLTAMLGLGGFIAWQTMQFSDKLTGGLPNAASTQFDFNPSYEYAVDFIFDSNLSGRMAQRGKEGWKVAGSRRTQDSITGQLGYEFIFLRETPAK